MSLAVSMTAVDASLRDLKAVGTDAASSARSQNGIWRACLLALALQFTGMLVFTTAEYHSFNLTTDFGAYAQAWTAIGHGHLSPYSSVFGLPFWRNDFELLMWPLALFYWLFPHAIVLLWAQVAAVVAAEAVVLGWGREVLARSRHGGRNAAWLLATPAALAVLTPWSWFTIGFDFHFEPFVALFGLLTARDLWRGRRRRTVAWAVLTLCSGAASGSLCLLAIGLAARLARERPKGTDKTAVSLLILAAGWLALASSLGAMRFRGETLSSMYGYLSGDATGHLTMLGLALALVAHPLRALQMLRSHAGYVAGYVASGGVIGLRSLWGLVPATLVILPPALNSDSNFIHFAQAFQTWPAVVFLLMGTLFALEALARGTTRSRPALVVAIATVAAAAAVAGTNAGQISGYLSRVSPAAARSLSALRAHTPTASEIIASQGIIGRFSAGRVALPYWAQGSPELFPLTAGGRQVVFIFSPREGTAEGDVSETMQAILYVRDDLRARRMVSADGIWAFNWKPARGRLSVRLP